MADPHPEVTRERILNKGILLFAANGFEGVSVRQVAHAVALTVSALYYHFPDKESLYLAAVEHSFNNCLTSATQTAQTIAEPWQRLTGFIHEFVHTLATNRDFQRLGNELQRLIEQGVEILADHRELAEGGDDGLLLGAIEQQFFRLLTFLGALLE